jgi:hypothetical protein
MAKPKNRSQRGETQHAEGQHGPKTHRAFIDQLEAGRPPERQHINPRHVAGRHRLSEDRESNSEVDKNSEANRKRQAVQRGTLKFNLKGVKDRLNGSTGH